MSGPKDAATSASTFSTAAETYPTPPLSPANDHTPRRPLHHIKRLDRYLAPITGRLRGWTTHSSRPSLARRRRSAGRRICSRRSRAVSRWIPLIGCGSGESFQLAFHGPGFTAVQPSEGQPVVASSLAERRRAGTIGCQSPHDQWRLHRYRSSGNQPADRARSS